MAGHESDTAGAPFYIACLIDHFCNLLVLQQPLHWSAPAGLPFFDFVDCVCDNISLVFGDFSQMFFFFIVHDFLTFSVIKCVGGDGIQLCLVF